jgi:hypothetical protein
MVLALKEKVSINISTLYDKDIDPIMLESFSDKMIIVKAPNTIVRNFVHKAQLLEVDKHTLELFNHSHLELDETEIVLPLFNFHYKDIIKYLSYYGSLNSIEEMYKIIHLANIFKYNLSNTKFTKFNLINSINALEESNYWAFKPNCRLNITKSFGNRRFRYCTTTPNEIIEFLKGIKEEEHNYLSFLINSDKFVDASNAVKDNYNYKLYYIDNEILDIKNKTLEVFKIVSDPVKYTLMLNMLVSKKYCHFIVNNSELLDLLKPIIDNNKEIFRYCLGYAWLTMTMEECIKKTRTTIADRYVFDFDTASKLPYYHFDNNNPHNNPYTPLLVNECLLKGRNVYGIQHTNYRIGNENFMMKDMVRVTTQEEFKRNLNIFSTGTEDQCIFDGLNWDNIAISGSVMTA